MRGLESEPPRPEPTPVDLSPQNPLPTSTPAPAPAPPQAAPPQAAPPQAAPPQAAPPQAAPPAPAPAPAPAPPSPPTPPENVISPPPEEKFTSDQTAARIESIPPNIPTPPPPPQQEEFEPVREEEIPFSNYGAPAPPVSPPDRSALSPFAQESPSEPELRTEAEPLEQTAPSLSPFAQANVETFPCPACQSLMLPPEAHPVGTALTCPTCRDALIPPNSLTGEPALLLSQALEQSGLVREPEPNYLEASSPATNPLPAASAQDSYAVDDNDTEDPRRPPHLADVADESPWFLRPKFLACFGTIVFVMFLLMVLTLALRR